MDYKLNTSTSYDSDYRKFFMNYFGTVYMACTMCFNAANLLSTFEKDREQVDEDANTHRHSYSSIIT